MGIYLVYGEFLEHLALSLKLIEFPLVFLGGHLSQRQEDRVATGSVRLGIKISLQLLANCKSKTGFTPPTKLLPRE